MKSLITTFFILVAAAGLTVCAAGCDFLGWEDPPEPPPGAWTFLGLGGENITAITALAVHPTNPNILYVGSGSNFSAQIPGKLFKSKDGGLTWDTLLVGGSYSDIAINPQNPNIVYALPGGVIKSTDGGKTWHNLSKDLRIPTIDRRAICVAINPRNPAIIYLGLGGFFGGPLVKSIDGGETWQELAPQNDYLSGISSIGIDPHNTNTLFVGAAGGMVLKSTDAGATWKVALGPTGYLADVVSSSPYRKNRVYTGISNDGFFVSDNRGDTWEEMESVSIGENGLYNDLVFDPAGRRRLYLATNEGIYYGEGGLWTYMNEGLPKQNRRVISLAAGPKGTTLYAGLSRTNVGQDRHGLYVRDLSASSN